MPSAKAAVLRQTGAPMTIETVEVGPLAHGDVLVRMRAASLCHTDLEAIEGSLPVALPAVLGHEAAGEVAEVGPAVSGLKLGDRVVLSWNPHCGACFYCERAQPILCRQFLANGPLAFHFDGKPRLSCDAVPVHQLMYLGSFAEYCIVPEASAVRVPDAMPFDRAALLGCGVMTGVGRGDPHRRAALGRRGDGDRLRRGRAVRRAGLRAGGRRRDRRGGSQSGAAAAGATTRRHPRRRARTRRSMSRACCRRIAAPTW